MVDKNSNTLTVTYTGNNLTQITDTVGRNIALTYDGNNRITQITDPDQPHHPVYLRCQWRSWYPLPI